MSFSPPALLGSQAPSYRSVPLGAASSWGPALTDFARSFDVILDPGQSDVLNDGTSLTADGLWLAREVIDNEPRQNGKTALLKVRGLGGVYLLNEPLIVWTAHEFKTAHRSFLEVKATVDNYDHLRKRVRSIRDSGARTEIELQHPTRLMTFLARSGGSGRGFAQVSPLFLDEMYALTAAQRAALQYAMSAARNPQYWGMSSAPLPDSEVFRDVVTDGRKGGKRTVYYEWSVRDDFRAVRRVAERNRVLIKAGQPGDEEFVRYTLASNRSVGRPGGVGVTIESAEEELKGSTDVEIFIRERWGVWPEGEQGGRINLADWANLADPDSRRSGDVSLGVDVSIGRAWYSIVLYGRREDGLGHVQLIKSGSDIEEIVPYLAEARDQLSPVCVAMGAGTYAALKVKLKAAGFLRPEDRPIDTAMRHIEGASMHPPQRGDLFALNGSEMGAACGAFLQAVRGGTLRHVPSDQLTSAAGVGQTRVSGGQLAWVTTDENVDITALVAASEGLYAHAARVDEIEDYDPLADIL
jgi:hypothetical protein